MGFVCFLFCVQILPSPTTGTFPGQGLNWKSSSGNIQQNVKKEDRSFSDFSFQKPARPSTTSSAMFQSSNSTVQPVSIKFFGEIFSVLVMWLCCFNSYW